MAKEGSSGLGVLGVVLATLIILTPIILYGYSKVKQSHQKEITDLKNLICRGYGFDRFEVYISPFTNESYDECSVTQPGCGGINYMPLDELIRDRGVLNQTLGCGGGSSNGGVLEVEE